MKLNLPLFGFGIVTFGCLVATSEITLAQVTPDGTVNTEVNQSGNVSEITGGETRGSNLFHSFREFSIRTGNEAFFNNAADIVNIFSRVTGGNISNIDGLLRANGGVNLFLINPAGIIFGNNARLDIGGSFYGTSADSILFEDGEFSATDLDNPPLLTINAPIGLNFRDEPGDIVNRASTRDGLEVTEGKDIYLIGGNVTFDGGIIIAPGGRIELGGLTETGTVTFNDDGSLSFPEGIARGNLSLNNASLISTFNSTGDAGNINFTTASLILNNGSLINASGTNQNSAGDITIKANEAVSLANQSNINVTTGASGGSLTLDAKSLEIIAESNISTGINLDSGSPQAQAGDITINVTEDILIDGASENPQTQTTNIGNTVFGGGEGKGGNITLNARNIEFKNGGNIFNSTEGQGSLGNITLTATEDIIFDGIGRIFRSGVNNFITDTGTGNVGNIEITAHNLTLTNGAVIQSLVAGMADSGNININVAERILVDGINSNAVLDDGTPTTLNSEITSTVARDGKGNSGDINITTGSLFLSNAGEVSSEILGQGNAGNIKIDATDTISLKDSVEAELPEVGIRPFSSNIAARVLGDAVGNGGNIEINTANFSITNLAQLTTSSFSQGDAGNITVNATDTFFANNSWISSNIGNFLQVPAVGKVGNISITAKNISFDGTAQIQAGASSGATAEATGIVSLTATESISFTDTNTGIFTSNDPDSFGNASNTKLSAPNITLNDGAVIIADNRANGRGGDINIETDRLILNNASVIRADAEGDRNAGDLTILATDSVTLTELSRISVDVLETGNSGNLVIETGKLTVTDGSQISASTFGDGNAGNLTIRATDFIELSDVSENGRGGLFASAIVGSGNGGNLSVFTNELIIRDGAIISASNFPSIQGLAEPGTGQPGNINIQANSINLENGGRIFAATQSEIGDGANITLNIADDITLEDNSFISARALNNADGGNLNINTNFIVAFPNQNNDIIANADRGNGGNINITAESVFGIEERALNNFTNDINASSARGAQFDGTVAITIPDINAIQTETQVPNNLIESEQTPEQACQSNRVNAAKNGLDILGKGGIPPQPIEPLQADNIIIDSKFAANYIPPEIKPIETDNGDIYPARGIIKTADGGIILTAYPTENIPTRTPIIKPNCN
jgi:filamentous hemagglutinin family protein